MIKTYQYVGDLMPLSRWAVSSQPDIPPEPFLSWIKSLLPSWCTSYGHWVGFSSPDSALSGDWVAPFPHRHVDSMGWTPETMTLLLYLTVPEEGGEIAIGGHKKTDPYTLVQPTPGLAVMCDSVTWHGVKPVVNGTRTALINTGWR